MKVEEKPNTTVIDLSTIQLPGWVWIAVAGLVIYLARTYVTDSGLVEVVTIAAYMVIKRLEVSGTNLSIEETADFFKRLHAEINTWRSRAAVAESAAAPGPVMRSGSTAALEVTKPVEVKTPNSWQRWMFD